MEIKYLILSGGIIYIIIGFICILNIFSNFKSLDIPILIIGVGSLISGTMMIFASFIFSIGQAIK